jgi:hypothetical protein
MTKSPRRLLSAINASAQCQSCDCSTTKITYLANPIEHPIRNKPHMHPPNCPTATQHERRTKPIPSSIEKNESLIVRLRALGRESKTFIDFDMANFPFRPPLIQPHCLPQILRPKHKTRHIKTAAERLTKCAVSSSSPSWLS